jgi:hypothetical protein
MRRLGARLACAAVVGISPLQGGAAWELSGSKAVVATTADATRVVLGTVDFTPGPDGSASFRLSMDPAPFEDHFLSMREFKCLPGGHELTCHVPYPHANPRTVSQGSYAWLEHSLLFFYKLPSDFGAKLWNGVYFEFRRTDAGLLGRPKAVDLNLIAAPPANPAVPPFRPALRDDMPSDKRWIRSLSIE